MTGQWFSPGTRVSSTNKTDHHDMTEILLKVALNTITLTLTSSTIIKLTWRLALFIHIYFVIMCLLHAIYLICWIKCVHLAQDVWYMSTQTIFVEYFKIRHVCTFHVQMRYETVNLVFLFCFVPVSKARTHTLYIPIPPPPSIFSGVRVAESSVFWTIELICLFCSQIYDFRLSLRKVFSLSTHIALMTCK